MTRDMRDAIALEFCEDCSTLEITGDATSFDYHYAEPESSQRLARCTAGFKALCRQGDVYCDSTDDVQRACSDCGHVGEQSTFPSSRDADDELVTLCPACGSEDTDERQSGYDEFSWSSCDCCGSHLGGARTRFALFPRTAEPPPAGEAGPVVPEQVERPAG